MTLVMFDVDGTLTCSNEIDSLCFVETMRDVLGLTDLDDDWSHYTHTSDLGIIDEIGRQRLGRALTAEELETFRQHFLRLLDAAFRQTPMEEIPGAGHLLSELKRRGDIAVSLASGAWRDSARAKMISAGLPFDDFPGAFSEQGPARIQIMRASYEAARVQVGEGHFTRWIYFGDAIWDVRACRALSVPLIGVAAGEKATTLLREGAVEVFADFSQPDKVMAAIDRVVAGY